MKFSLSLPRPADRPDPAQMKDLVMLARAAEQAGLTAVSASDHPFPVTAPGRAGHQALDPFVLLGHLSALTERLRLHFSLIVLPYRNPFLVARMLATMDLVSGGRVIAGLGAGYLREEFDALGAGYPARSRLVTEGVAAMRTAWTGEPVSMRGDGWHAAGNVMRPTPLTSSHPVLWRGGNTRAAIEHAAQDLDGWCPFEVNGDGARQTTTREVSTQTLSRQVAVLREALDRAGRDGLFDICLVRTSRRWLRDASFVIEDLQALEATGVTWLELTVPGESAAEQIDGVQRFAELARAAGVG
jgi:probable F420-dependent oxidoreductase